MVLLHCGALINPPSRRTNFSFIRWLKVSMIWFKVRLLESWWNISKNLHNMYLFHDLGPCIVHATMGMPFTESDWIFNFQSVSVKFTPLYRGHDFYRKWLNFLCWISASFCKTHLIIWWCMNFTESDWNSGNTVATISASFCKIHALYIRSEFYRKWLKIYSVTRSKLFN